MIKKNDNGKAFLTGEDRNVWDVREVIRGAAIGDDPGDSVNYVAAHDGLTLHDTIVTQMGLDPENDRDEIFKRIKLNSVILLTSQGIAFIHAGQEMGRSKEMKGEATEDEQGKMVGKYVRDSFDASDSINKIDWSELEKNRVRELYNYTAGVIKLRRSTDGFRLGRKDLIEGNVNLSYCDSVDTYGQAIVYESKSTSGEIYFVFINGYNYPKDFETTHIDISDGVVIVDSDEAGIDQVNQLSGVVFYSDKITIDPLLNCNNN